jgi:hypothetical protein
MATFTVATEVCGAVWATDTTTKTAPAITIAPCRNEAVANVEPVWAFHFTFGKAGRTWY